MEATRKEIRNRRLLAIFAALFIGLAYHLSGQVTKEIKYKIVSDTVLSLDASQINIGDVNRVYASNVDPEGNEISFELPILKIDKENNVINVSFFKLAFFPGNASGRNPDYINFMHGDSGTDVFFTDGKKLVDIWYKRVEK